jgi:hypothetical protein
MNLRNKLYLLTLASLLLALGAGWILKTQALARPQLLGWGFIFVAGCISAARGFMILGKKPKL